MGFDQGRIIVDSDNGAYYSGQTVHGKLVFDQDKVKTFRGIYAKIKGYCDVHWTTHHTRRVSDGQGGHRSESYTENHNSHEVYVERKVFLVGGESGEHRLQPGKHEFNFEFPLPANCPSSYEGEYGHIRYEIKVVVDRAFKLDQEKKIALRVIAPLDLNADPYCREPMAMEFNDSYCCCCFSSGACETLVKLPRSGYCPGQTIPVEVSCSNKGDVEVEISFAIYQRIEFTATNHPGTKSNENKLAKIKKGPIPGNTTRNWTFEMDVPTIDVYNVNTCRYIDVDYVFKVTVSPEGCHEDSDQTQRLVIGTVPIAGFQDNYQNPMQNQMPSKPLINMENHQIAPQMQTGYPGPVISQPMPNVYPVGNSPYPGNNPPYPGSNPPYPGSNPPYPGMSPYPQPAPNPHPPGFTSPYPATNPPYPGNQNVSPYPTGTNTSPYPANPYPGVAVPVLPPGANIPYPMPVSQASPFVNASAPEPATPDAMNKNPMDENTANKGLPPPYNPNY